MPTPSSPCLGHREHVREFPSVCSRGWQVDSCSFCGQIRPTRYGFGLAMMFNMRTSVRSMSIWRELANVLHFAKGLAFPKFHSRDVDQLPSASVALSSSNMVFCRGPWGHALGLLDEPVFIWLWLKKPVPKWNPVNGTKN